MVEQQSKNDRAIKSIDRIRNTLCKPHIVKQFTNYLIDIKYISLMIYDELNPKRIRKILSSSQRAPCYITPPNHTIYFETYIFFFIFCFGIQYRYYFLAQLVNAQTEFNNKPMITPTFVNTLVLGPICEGPCIHVFNILRPEFMWKSICWPN